MFRIMLVDDEALALIGLKSIIDWEAYGLRICAACESAREALEQAQTLRPDAIFTDIYMPDLNGMDLFTRLREAGLDIELVIVSAYSDFEVARAAINCGALSYLLKPLQEDEVRDAAVRLVKRLRQKAGGALSLSLEEPSEAEAQLESMTLAENLYVVIGNAEGLAQTEPQGQLVELRVEGVDEQMYLCAFPAEAAFPPGLFTSGRFTDRRLLPEMVQRAVAAQRGNFVYSRNGSIADMQFYIATNYASALSLKTISERFYLSQTYLSNFFKKHTDQNLINFVNHVRISNACYMLSHSSIKLKVLPSLVGFNDYSYFSKQFRQIVGISPEQYRRDKALDKCPETNA